MVGPDSATVNGLYQPTDEIHNDEALYVKEEDSGTCIRYAKDKRWTVSDLYHKDANINGGFLKCAEKHLPDPTNDIQLSLGSTPLPIKADSPDPDANYGATRYLGLWLDDQLRFDHHINIKIAIAEKRLQALQCT